MRNSSASTATNIRTGCSARWTRTKKCEDVKGQPVGVNSEGGARSIALNQLIRSCGLTAKDTQQVALSLERRYRHGLGPDCQTSVFCPVDDVPMIERKKSEQEGDPRALTSTRSHRSATT